MQAVYLTEPGRFRVQARPDPRLIAPDDVLLEMQGVGVCGSDMHYFKSGRIGTQVIEYPFILGHECAAVVREVGSGVTGLAAGDRVAVDPLVNCGRCNVERADLVAEVRLARPHGLDVVFECSGELDALEQAAQVLKPGGTLLLAGIPESRRVSFDISLLRRKELTIKNVRRQNDCTQAAIDVLGSGNVDLDPLVTHHFRFGESQSAFELVGGYRDGVVKALVHFD